MYKISIFNLGYSDLWISKLNDKKGSLNELLEILKEELEDILSIDGATITKNFNITEKDFLESDDLYISVVDTNDLDTGISICFIDL